MRLIIIIVVCNNLKIVCKNCKIYRSPSTLSCCKMSGKISVEQRSIQLNARVITGGEAWEGCSDSDGRTQRNICPEVNGRPCLSFTCGTRQLGTAEVLPSAHLPGWGEAQVAPGTALPCCQSCLGNPLTSDQASANKNVASALSLHTETSPSSSCPSEHHSETIYSSEDLYSLTHTFILSLSMTNITDGL